MAKKRTTAQRRAAAKAAWALRKLKSAKAPTPVATPAGYEGVMNAPGYEALAFELQAAFEQSAHGKGRERHANGRSFDRQPIMELGRLYGPGFTAGQAAKKTQEGLSNLLTGNFDPAKALVELHGAIVYIAATAAMIRESVKE